MKRGGPIQRKTALRRVGRSAFEPRRGPSVAELDQLARLVVFARDGYRCLKCGKACDREETTAKGERRFIGIQWAHVRGKGAAGHAARWDPDNAITLCPGCHLKWHSPVGWDPLAWFRELRPGVLEKVDARIAATRARGHKVDRALVALALGQIQRGGGKP